MWTKLYIQIYLGNVTMGYELQNLYISFSVDDWMIGVYGAVGF